MPATADATQEFLAARDFLLRHREDCATAYGGFDWPLLAHSRAVLAPYKRIRRLEFAELPKTVSGKIRRIELRQRTADGDVTTEYREEDHT